MNWINEYGIQPGTYQHYKGGLYVLVEIVNYADNPETGLMEKIEDPFVIYRDVVPMVEHVNGKPITPHKRYMRTLSEFNSLVDHNNVRVKRFTQI